MNISIETPKEDILLLSTVGSLDIYSASNLKKTFTARIRERKRKVLIDLGSVTYIDSSGIGILLNIYTTCQKQNLPICFCGMHGIVSKILKLTRLEHFLPSALDRTRGVDYLEKQNLSQSHPHIIKQIIIDDTHPLLQPDNMYYKKFNIDLSQARRLANLISQKSPVELREFNILEQQICEIIKNAVKHGNKNNPEKSIDVWFEFSESHARLIVQDEGSGFQDIEKWNEFYRNKISCYRSHDYEKMMDYLRFTTLSSDETDGGNAMCAAVEYWNEGVVYSASRNKVGVMRMFHSD